MIFDVMKRRSLSTPIEMQTSSRLKTSVSSLGGKFASHTNDSLSSAANFSSCHAHNKTNNSRKVENCSFLFLSNMPRVTHSNLLEMAFYFICSRFFLLPRKHSNSQLGWEGAAWLGRRRGRCRRNFRGIRCMVSWQLQQKSTPNWHLSQVLYSS